MFVDNEGTVDINSEDISLMKRLNIFKRKLSKQIRKWLEYLDKIANDLKNNYSARKFDLF